MCCKRYHIIFSTFSLKFKCKICVQKEVIHNFKNHILVTWPFTNLLILRKWCSLCGFKNQITITLLRYDPQIVFRKQTHITFIFIKTMSHDLLVQMAYSIVSHQLRYKVCSINVSVFLMSFFNVVTGSNGPQKFCIEKVGKETWLPRSHTWQVSSNSVNSSRISSVWFCYKHLTISHALIDWELRTMRE